MNSASPEPISARQNTRLESEGAEFLVLGNLLIEGIPAYKTYTNMRGYDIVATDPERGSAARIQVKSRWRTNAEGFIINNFECDFVVAAMLNRGSKDGTREKLQPRFYIFPVEVIASLPRSRWGKLGFGKIAELDRYAEDWRAIRRFLDRMASP